MPLLPRLPSEALASIPRAGLRTLQVQPYLPDFPALYGASVILGVRTCLPLRGSSGFLTGFPFNSPRGETVENSLYLGLIMKCKSTDCGYSAYLKPDCLRV
jgi:hypothetical protein